MSWLTEVTAVALESSKEIERLRATLSDIRDLVEDYADVDDGQPNLAMRVMTAVDFALRKTP